ncbi:hypothetical protein BST61_g10348 [Cercospora zeina]
MTIQNIVPLPNIITFVPQLPPAIRTKLNLTLQESRTALTRHDSSSQVRKCFLPTSTDSEPQVFFEQERRQPLSCNSSRLIPFLFINPFDPPTVCIAMTPKARTAKFAGSWKDMLVLQPYDTQTRWDAYHYRWATREWDFRFTGTFEDEEAAGPRMGRVVRFVCGPGFEGAR